MKTKSKRPEMRPAYCPACKFYQVDCNTDAEDWTLPCECYEPNPEADAPPVFEAKRMLALICQDGFLENVFKRSAKDEHALTVMFNTYVLDDSVMIERYKQCGTEAENVTDAKIFVTQEGPTLQEPPKS